MANGPHRSPDSSTFADALASERAYLLRSARRRLRDSALAEDAVQDTLLAALQSRPGFEQRSTLRTWLTTILLRRIGDGVRREGRAPRVAMTDTLDDEAWQGDGAVDWICPRRRLEGRQFIGALEDCLAALPRHAARLFTLREIDGLSHDEATRSLGLTRRDGTLLLHRARARLRDGLAAHGVVG